MKKKNLKYLAPLILLFLFLFKKKNKEFNKNNTVIGKAKKYCPENKTDDKFIELLNKINNEFYKKYKIDLVDRATSIYRCPEYNSIVGGVPDSAHVKGLAGDFKLSFLESRDLKDIARRFGVKRFIYHSPRIGEHLHLDIDGSKPACDVIKK